VSTGELEERRPVDDRERALAFGAEFRLGAVERVSHEVILGRKGMPTEQIAVSGLANGIFLPAPLAYAAGRRGVLVTGYHQDGGGIPDG
jgi:hypothetical protein